MRFHLAYTSRINAPGVTPVLTKAQVWAGLQHKIRNAHEFVPFFEACRVLEEVDGVVTREVTLKQGTYTRDKIQEVVTSYWPTWVSEMPFLSLVEDRCESETRNSVAWLSWENLRYLFRSISYKKTEQLFATLLPMVHLENRRIYI